MMRYQSTAFTLIVTLSRVMVSCCSADTVRVRMSTRDRALDTERNDPVQAGTPQPLEASQPEHHAALVFLRNPQAREENDHDDGDDELREREHAHLVATATAAAAIRVPLPRFISLTARGFRNHLRARAAMST